jgi:peptide deformylase
MSVLTIARMGAEVLQYRATEVAEFKTPALQAFVADMIDTMLDADGVGLAAPQVFRSERIVIFYVPAARNRGVEIPLTVMINPVITPLDGDQEEAYEACLSVAGLTGRVPRFTHIKYRFQDIIGATIEREAQGFHARVVQHECDHLDGVLYPQRMANMSSLAFSNVLHAEAKRKGEAIELDEEG